MVNKLLSSLTPADNDKLSNIIQFYKSVVELEQLKEPEITEMDIISPINHKSNEFNLEISKSVDLKNKLNENNKEKWPKDICIIIYIELKNGNRYSLLNYIIPNDSVNNAENIAFSLSDFVLNLKVAKELELTKTQIEDIEYLISTSDSLEVIQMALKNIMCNDIIIPNYISLALSSKNRSLNQIHSELNKLLIDNKKSLLYSFLTYTNFTNKVSSLSDEDIIQISSLDYNQRRAVLGALNNRVSVVTGPPGNGKTQVILNILVNALLHDKKVLVASKNNKAVDNVKDRFKPFVDFDYLVRFGSSKILETETLDQLNSILSSIDRLKDLPSSSSVYEEFDKLRTLIKKNNADIIRRGKLRESISADKIEIDRLVHLNADNHKLYESNIIQIKESKSFIPFSNSYDIATLDDYKKQFRIERNRVQSNCYGLYKLWFKWFRCKKCACILLNLIENLPQDIKEYIYLYSQNIKSNVIEYKTAQNILMTYNDIINILGDAMSCVKELSICKDKYKKTKIDNETTIQRIEEKLRIDEMEVKDIHSRMKLMFSENETNSARIKMIGRDLLLEVITNKLKNATSACSVTEFRKYISNEKPWRLPEINSYIVATNMFLDVVGINAVTALSAKGSYPLSSELFDILVIDEASQCDIASAIPLIKRAKQIVVIGDPMQLTHISSVKREEEWKIKQKLLLENDEFINYNNKSLWDYCEELLRLHADESNSPTMLDHHYRCHPDIINYSNKMFYEKRMGQKLIVKTTDEQFSYIPKGIVWIDVKGVQFTDKINRNELEATTSIDLAINIHKKNPNLSIGIITPFKNQAECIYDLISSELKNIITVDTVHKFQGDEKDIIIYSLVVTDNSPKSKIQWIDNTPNLVNVAVTRARNTLYIVGNVSYIRKESSETRTLGSLAYYN